ncbi:hypothetical protein BpHYR1_024093 [Brachionus plicatilis]|uniref:MULE transposase domain-containing protein n=1 Tax=Brachionus plicatilis TaxID=10195 RepID=A0A3M7Q1F0_BRAPC|nr:hypothetical protein BpHYR1_024093 [Brachionus plicatilis]
MYPACYILLQNKERETYVQALTNLKEIFTRNNCSIVLQRTLSDFELAMIQAISFEFENVKIYGCEFHFNQAIMRYLFNKCNKQALYFNDYNFKQLIRKFSALALDPLKDVQTGWNVILNTLPAILGSDLLKFIKYFVNTWLQGKYGFSWNHFDNNGPRTNNHYRQFNKKF